FALGQELALRRKAAFEVVDAAAEHLGFLDSHDQLAIEIVDASAEVFDAAARIGQFAGGFLGLGAFSREAGLRLRKFLFGVADAGSQSFDSRAHGNQFDSAGVGGHRAVGQFVIDPGQLGSLVGQRGLCAAQQFGLGGEFLLGGAQSFLDRLLARLEPEDGGVLFAEL
ncbi:hypothetical protein OY671_011076, partial [Metschnikowia pulcherrima]